MTRQIPLPKLEPEDHAAQVAHFRMQVLGPVLGRSLGYGELMPLLKELADQRYRLPGAARTSRLSVTTLRRWLRAFRKSGLAGLRPLSRRTGHASALTDEQRDLLLEVRMHHPHAASTVILQWMEDAGLMKPGVVGEATVRRLFRERGFPRRNKGAVKAGEGRRSWVAKEPGELWHADVCHPSPIEHEGKKTPVRVHALLDDHSRYVVTVDVLNHEQEVAMLDLVMQAVRAVGSPRTLYLDNGSTYRGHALEIACARMNVTLRHAAPYDPQARGKMERLWRTARERCLDVMGSVASLHDVKVRMLAFVDRYNNTPHGALRGQTPRQVWAKQVCTPVTEEGLVDALTVRENRTVTDVCTVHVGGVEWELSEPWLVGKKVTMARTLADPQRPPWIEHDGRRLLLRPVDPIHNGQVKRVKYRQKAGAEAVPFDPATAAFKAWLRRRVGGIR